MKTTDITITVNAGAMDAALMKDHLQKIASNLDSKALAVLAKLSSRPGVGKKLIQKEALIKTFI